MEDLGVERSIILKLILKKQNVRTWAGLTWLRVGKIGGLFNETLHCVVVLLMVVCGVGGGGSSGIRYGCLLSQAFSSWYFS